jgi:hypothetical protein
MVTLIALPPALRLSNADRMNRVCVTRMPLELRNSFSSLFWSAADANAIASRIFVLPLPLAPMSTVTRPRFKVRSAIDL